MLISELIEELQSSMSSHGDQVVKARFAEAIPKAYEVVAVDFIVKDRNNRKTVEYYELVVL